jgi:biofilm PGA synthesis lipoprotein PgaB
MKFFLIPIVFLFFVTNSFALKLIETEYPQIIGVQIFNLAKKYEYNLDHYMYSLKRSGINTVIIRVFQNKDDRVHFKKYNKNYERCKSGVYFQTGQSCMVNDVLSQILNSAKKFDIKVFAWMATRSLSFLKDNYGYEQIFTEEGIKKGYGANIFNPTVRKKILKLFEDLAFYDIDGILIQDDYILKYNEGASTYAKQRFYDSNGIIVNYNKLFKGKTKLPLYKEWNDWKMKELSSFLQEIRIHVKKINPKIKFAVNTYYETPLFPDNGLSWYSQSIPQYVKMNFEYYAYMGYHEQISDETGLSRYAAINYVKNSIKRLIKLTGNPSRAMLKIQIRSFHKDRKYINLNEIRKLCNLTETFPGLSIVLVPFESINDLKKCKVK